MKYYIFTLYLFLFSIGGFSQSLYDINTIQDIRIVFAQSNWDALLDAEKAGADGYIEAQSVTINGTVFNTVGVKYKGNSSYNASYVKNPFHIELDTYVDQNYQGYKDLKLSNVIYDPSFVRETVSYNILRKYMHAPLANYANVYVNGTLIGLYTNVEAINKKFVEDHFGSKTNAFFSCSPPAGAGPTTTNLPGLTYLGTNYTSYESAYEMKSDAGWDDLIALANTLNNNTTQIETVLDVDKALWMLAFDNVLVNLDSYIGKFKQNWYLYKDNSGLFNSIVWDLNMSFGVFNDTGTGSLTSTTAKKQLTHLLHTSDSGWPLVQKLLGIAKYKKMYLAHYKTILSENIANNSYYTTAQAYQAIINTSVQADPNKFYTYANFSSNMTTDINVGMNTAPGLSNLMSGRNNYLAALTDFTNTQPTISSITPSNITPTLGSSVTITANVINTNATAVYLGYRSNNLSPFTKVLMYDDGAHNDGPAGNNVYGTSITIDGINTQYYIYAENNNIGKFSPERAEYEFYTLTASYPVINVGDVTINELMAQNTNGATDEAGDYEDWVELYNNTSTDLDLGGHYLSDNTTTLTKWTFPLNSVIPANGYMIIWADDEAAEGPLHAAWKLSVSGESCTLSTPTQSILDQVIFGVQTTNMGYARVPNGTGSFVIQLPSFNSNNNSLSVNNFEFEKDLRVFPNPTNGLINIQNKNFPLTKIELYNLQGQLLKSHDFENENNVNIDGSELSNGLYILKINQSTTVKIFKN